MQLTKGKDLLHLILYTLITHFLDSGYIPGSVLLVGPLNEALTCRPGGQGLTMHSGPNFPPSSDREETSPYSGHFIIYIHAITKQFTLQQCNAGIDEELKFTSEWVEA